MDKISSGISELNATFHWGFGQVIASLGHMNDTLDELVKIAKTPVQTVAFNHFEIARDAFRQGLYQECLEELDKAIAGDHTSAGYKLEWRFHQLLGTVRLGFADGDLALVDLAKAEESFLLAARYGKTDYPSDAGWAMLSAGWAAYCQGKMTEALAHSEQAMTLHPRLGEAFFQAAKVRMYLGLVDAALPVLSRAIDLDRFYALKAAGDGDFQKYDDRLRGFLEAMRVEKYRQSVPLVQAALDKLSFWREHAPEAKQHPQILRMDEFLASGGTWPLLDMLAVVQTLDTTMGAIEVGAREARILLRTKISGTQTRTRQETVPVEETYQEKVIIEPGGFFRRAVTEMRTKTRTVMQTRTVQYTLDGVRLDVHDGFGALIASHEFCFIPAGSFMMGEGNNQHQVTISRDFLMGKYPVTQAFWQAVMGENPSHFNGPERPVENVSWEDCQRFITKINLTTQDGLRLPTEAEWEYACRAGSTTAYCFGDDEPRLGDYAWYDQNSGSQTHPVGKKQPNDWGLYDMHGNVWEWCRDWRGDYLAGSVTDPTGPTSGSHRVLRGGSWNCAPRILWSAARSGSGPGYRDSNLGFRLLLPVQ